MSKEIENLIANTKNRDALARIFDHLADRLDAVVAERHRKSAERKADGGADGRA